MQKLYVDSDHSWVETGYEEWEEIHEYDMQRD